MAPKCSKLTDNAGSRTITFINGDMDDIADLIAKKKRRAPATSAVCAIRLCYHTFARTLVMFTGTFFFHIRCVRFRLHRW